MIKLFEIYILQVIADWILVIGLATFLAFGVWHLLFEEAWQAWGASA